MKKIVLTLLSTAFLLGTTACRHSADKGAEGHADVAAIMDSATRIVPVYAQGFKVKYLDNGVRLVEIAEFAAKGNNQRYRHARGDSRDNECQQYV